MLVKFLSFTASVIGTASYKAIFLSCFVLVFSIAGVVGALWHGNDPHSAASTLEKTDTQDNTQPGSPQLGNNRKQTIQNEGSVGPQANEQPSDSTQITPTPKPTTSTGSEASTAKQISMTLDKITLAIVPGEKSESVTATAVLPANAQWRFITDPALGLEAITENESASTLTFHIQTKQDIDKDRSYEAMVQIINSDQAVLATKRISITIL